MLPRRQDIIQRISANYSQGLREKRILICWQDFVWVMLKVCLRTIFRFRMLVSGQALVRCPTSLRCSKGTVKWLQANTGKTRSKRDEGIKWRKGDIKPKGNDIAFNFQFSIFNFPFSIFHFQFSTVNLPHAAFGNSLRALLAFSIFSINIPYPSVGLATHNQAKRVGKLACQRVNADCSASVLRLAKQSA